MACSLGWASARALGEEMALDTPWTLHPDTLTPHLGHACAWEGVWWEAGSPDGSLEWGGFLLSCGWHPEGEGEATVYRGGFVPQPAWGAGLCSDKEPSVSRGCVPSLPEQAPLHPRRLGVPAATPDPSRHRQPQPCLPGQAPLLPGQSNPYQLLNRRRSPSATYCSGQRRLPAPAHPQPSLTGFSWLPGSVTARTQAPAQAPARLGQSGLLCPRVGAEGTPVELLHRPWPQERIPDPLLMGPAPESPWAHAHPSRPEPFPPHPWLPFPAPLKDSLLVPVGVQGTGTLALCLQPLECLKPLLDPSLLCPQPSS